MFRMHIPLALAILTLSLQTGCVVKNIRESQEAQIKAQSDASAKNGFGVTWSNYKAQYEQYLGNIELQRAALDGYEEKFTDEMRADPQHDALMKMRATADKNVAEIVDAYPTLTEWAESKKDAPTIEETQALNAKYNHMAQTFARALTTYGKLRSEYLGLMSRHPEKK